MLRTQNTIRLVFMLIIAIALIGLVPRTSRAKKEAPNEFIAGYDHSSTLLAPWKLRGKNFRKRLARIEENYKEYCEKYMPDMVTECLIRILIESDGHEGSCTKDTYMREAGPTSIGYNQAVTLCEKYGVCGDPCWNKDYAVGAYAWLVYEDRTNTFEKAWWRDWLPALCEERRAECELILAWNMDVNSGKTQLILQKTGAKKKKRPWHSMVKWFRKQTNTGVAKLLGPLAVSIRRFGIRAGFAKQKQKIRKERNGGKFEWGELYKEPPAKPLPGIVPDEKDWRKTCHHFKSDKWCNTHPTLSKKGKKKCRDLK